MQNNCHQNERTLKQDFANTVQKHQRMYRPNQKKDEWDKEKIKMGIIQTKNLRKINWKLLDAWNVTRWAHKGKIKNTSVS